MVCIQLMYVFHVHVLLLISDTILPQNAFWAVANSDPYKAVSYDTLHADDLGKWGKHLYSDVLVNQLEAMKKGGEFQRQ